MRVGDHLPIFCEVTLTAIVRRADLLHLQLQVRMLAARLHRRKRLRGDRD
jgi:hypothetical protein